MGVEILDNGTRVLTAPGATFGTDALLLARFAQPRRNERALDLCSGCGIVSLVWHDAGHRGPCTALEIDPAASALCAAALAENADAAHIAPVCGDLRQLCTAGPEQGQYDFAACNPPYFTAGPRSPDPRRAEARHTGSCTTADAVDCARRALRDGGRFLLCQRPEQLAEILAALRAARLEPKRLAFVKNRPDAAPPFPRHHSIRSYCIMGLFTRNFDKPGPGVSPDAPRKKGAARFFEILGRDFSTIWLAGILAMLGGLPFAAGVWFAVETHSLVPLVIAGVLGGMIAAPQIVGLNDTILRTLRDEPGYWWETYRRTWKRNLKESLLPGAVCGLLLAMELFSLCHINIAGGQVAVIAVLVALILLAGIAQYLYVQVALLDLSFAGLLKNSLMLFLGYLPRSGLGLLWQLLYWGAVALFWPISSFVLILTSLWLPCLLSLMAIYPALEKSFDIEKKIKAIREAQLHGDDDQ